MTGGKLITFEGGEGSGKSTQAQRLAGVLHKSGTPVLVTREPGGTALGEKIRPLILAERPQEPLTEFLLFAAARAEHVTAVIAPALRRGSWVICDRFIDSTRVYQGDLAGIDAELIAAVESATAGACAPDLTIILDVPAELGWARAHHRGETSRYDSANLATYETLRQGFLRIATAEPTRCVVIDGIGPADSVHAAVWAAVSDRLIGQAG